MLELMEFYFYVGVVANGSDMAGLPVRGIDGKFADHGCNVHGDTVDVCECVYGGKVVPTVVGGDMVKAMCEASRDGGVELSS